MAVAGGKAAQASFNIKIGWIHVKHKCLLHNFHIVITT